MEFWNQLTEITMKMESKFNETYIGFFFLINSCSFNIFLVYLWVKRMKLLENWMCEIEGRNFEGGSHICYTLTFGGTFLSHHCPPTKEHECYGGNFTKCRLGMYVFKEYIQEGKYYVKFVRGFSWLAHQKLINH